MDHLQEILAFGGVIMRHDKRRHEQPRFFEIIRKKICRNFFPPIFQIIGIQVEDELEQTPPLCQTRKKMVMDPVGWSPRAPNAEKREILFLLKEQLLLLKLAQAKKLKSPNSGTLDGNRLHQCDRNTYRVAADSDETRNGAGRTKF